VGEGDYRTSTPSSAGWYVDPNGSGGLRWWDGIGWTDDYADGSSVDGAPLPPPRKYRPYDQQGGRPARGAKPRRAVFIGLGIVVLFATGAIVGWAINEAAGTKGSIPNLATVQIAAGFSDNGAGVAVLSALHDQQVVRIVATGLTPNIQYSAEECKSVPEYNDAGDCDYTATLSADPSGTLRVEYTARKGPFGKSNVTCSTPSSCEIDIWSNELAPDDQQSITVYLNFAKAN
jgi:hypothetical protein